MISFVIPIYNAEKIIQDNYKNLKTQLDKINYDYEIIFEDDASSDRSKNILNEIAYSDRRVKVFSHYLNRGLGFTLRNLFESASGDIIVYLDIDLPFLIDSLPELLKETQNYDVILASRYNNPKSRIPVTREISSWLYYRLCKILFNITVRDLGSGFVIFKKPALDNLNLTSCGFDIHIELFVKLQKQGALIKELPLRYTSNGYTTFSIVRHGPQILVNTLKFWLKNR